MIKLVNRLTKTIMWVADERIDEYLAAGHRLAADTQKPTSGGEATPKRGRKKKEG